MSDLALRTRSCNLRDRKVPEFVIGEGIPQRVSGIQRRITGTVAAFGMLQPGAQRRSISRIAPHDHPRPCEAALDGAVSPCCSGYKLAQTFTAFMAVSAPIL